jgi:hypothetical protein
VPYPGSRPERKLDVSDLIATPVLVRPGADVRTLRTHEPARVVGPCRHQGTGQEGVVVEGPPGVYTYYTLEAFGRLFGTAEGPPPGKVPRAGGARPVRAARAPEMVADQTDNGKGY